MTFTDFPCGACGAGVDEHGVTASGHYVSGGHTGRGKAEREATRNGFFVSGALCCMSCGAVHGEQVAHKCVTRKPVLISGDYGALQMEKADFFSQRVEMSRHRTNLGGMK